MATEINDINNNDDEFDFSTFLEKKTAITNEDVDRLMQLFGKFNCTTVWSKVKRDDFTVRRFELGYVNDVCCCELTPNAMKRLEVKPNDDDNDDDDDCTAIVVKFRNKSLSETKDDENSWIDMNTIYVAMAQIGITPRLLYIDGECSVHKYIPARTYTYEDDCEPETVRQLAQILARIHCLRLPLSGNCHTIWQLFKSYQKNFLKSSKKSYLDYLEQDTQERKDKYYETLAQMDLKEPFRFVMDLVRKVNSPVMMLHGDYNRTNQLVKVMSNNKKKIFIIDFDHGGYAYRGLDFGVYFSNYKHKQDMFGSGDVPTDEEMSIFLLEYQAECARLLGNDRFRDDSRNTLEHLLLEAKAFTLFVRVFDTSFCSMMYKPTTNSEKADYYLNATVDLYQCYQKLKRHMTDDGTIEKILE